MRRNPKQRASGNEAVRHFMDWCAFEAVPMPATGEDVAAYLLDMMADGVPLAMLERAAAAIAEAYQERQTFLDLRPIQAALEIAEAQLDEGRVIN